MPRPSYARRGERVPYELLTPAQREELHAWVRTHGLDPRVTPIDALIEYDEDTREWLIEQHVLRNGRPYVGPDDEVVTGIVRCADRGIPLPWPAMPQPRRITPSTPGMASYPRRRGQRG